MDFRWILRGTGLDGFFDGFSWFFSEFFPFFGKEEGRLNIDGVGFCFGSLGFLVMGGFWLGGVWIWQEIAYSSKKINEKLHIIQIILHSSYFSLFPLSISLIFSLFLYFSVYYFTDLYHFKIFSALIFASLHSLSVWCACVAVKVNMSTVLVFSSYITCKISLLCVM